MILLHFIKITLDKIPYLHVFVKYIYMLLHAFLVCICPKTVQEPLLLCFWGLDFSPRVP